MKDPGKVQVPKARACTATGAKTERNQGWTRTNEPGERERENILNQKVKAKSWAPTHGQGDRTGPTGTFIVGIPSIHCVEGTTCVSSLVGIAPEVTSLAPGLPMESKSWRLPKNLKNGSDR